MAITWSEGHWRSERTVEEEIELLRAEITKLPRDRRIALKALLSDLKKGDTTKADIIAANQWEEVPLPIEDWLKSEEHVGELTESIFPAIRDAMLDLFKTSCFSNRYCECILTGSIGWGKSFLATFATMRVLYELLCLKNPPRALGLAAGEALYVIPISATKHLAKKVVFGGVAKKLMISPWFQKRAKAFGYDETQEEIRFRKKGIYIEGGGSNESHVLGLNTFLTIVDESNFFGKSKSKTLARSREVYDKAETIYRNLVRRIASRFLRVGVTGKVFLVSSKRSTEDFVERRIKEAMHDPGVMVKDYASWDMMPDKYADQPWHRVVVSPDGSRSRLLSADEEAPEGALVIDIPDDYREYFESNPEGSLIEFAGVALESVLPFLTNRKAIDVMMTGTWPNPITNEEWCTENKLTISWESLITRNVHNEFVPRCCPNAPRHGHLDMSTVKCATGFCIGHRAGTVGIMRRDPKTGIVTVDDSPIIHIDMILRVTPPNSGQIEHAMIRQFIYALIKYGMPIRSFSSDQYCAPPNLQPLAKKGLHTEEISVIRTLRPYLTLRSAINEGRVQCPYHSVLRSELRFLELDEKGSKVVHPPHSSQDLSDALTGVVYYLTNNSAGYSVLPSRGIVEEPKLVMPVYTQQGGVIFPDEAMRFEDNDDDGAFAGYWA